MRGAWKTAVADALDEQAAAIMAALAELDNVHAVLEARGSDGLEDSLRRPATKARR